MKRYLSIGNTTKQTDDAGFICCAGRRHLTQAISMAQSLQQAGHQLVKAWVNVAEGRPVPPFFQEQFKAPITAVVGPLLIYNPQTNAFD